MPKRSRWCSSERPDVVLMDIRMPTMDGLEATRHIVASTLETRVLVLTTFDLDEYVFAALKAGASGFLLKDTPPAALLAGIRTVAGGRGAAVTQHHPATHPGVRPPPDQPSRFHPPSSKALTDRELEVLALVARGWSNVEVAERLFITPATTKSHVSRLLMKLGARDRAQLIVMAYEVGLVSPGS